MKSCEVPLSTWLRTPKHMDRFQPAHVHDDPKDVGLAHGERENTEDNRPEVVDQTGTFRAQAVEMVSVGHEHK
jgi:hypothetical protein